MAPKNIFPKTPLSLDSVQLGRLVLNTRYPQQDYLDPPAVEPPEITVNPLHNFEEIRSSARASKLRARLLSLLSVSFQNRSEELIDLSATRASTYLLNNSKTWFNRACTTPETRKWLESAIEDDDNVYLVVGYHTLVDARFAGGSTTAEMGALQTSVNVNATFPAAGALDLTSSVDGALQVGQGYKRSFTTAGEQIYAVQYRKLRFKWYSSRSVENTFLEQGNRWKVYWSIRGEDTGNDDVVEAEQTDELDLEEEEEDDDDEENEIYVTEDGETEYVF